MVAGIEFLTAVGPEVRRQRQEFILLSDTLGLSILVDRAQPPEAGRRQRNDTDRTVLPRRRTGVAAWRRHGQSDPTGQPALISGRVTGLDGTPIANALLDVWQSSSEGLLRLADGSRARSCTCGEVPHRQRRPVSRGPRVRSTIPCRWTAPSAACWRSPTPPLAAGARALRGLGAGLRDAGHAHLRQGQQYLDSDTVFAVKDSLITEFAEQTTPDETAKQLGVPTPYAKVHYDFVLKSA